MLFNPRIFDESWVQAQYLENIRTKNNIQEVINRKRTKTHPRREIRSGKGKKRI
jgi:hypothetical protein